MRNPMKEQSSFEVKRGVCCFKFAEVMLGLNMGVRVPFSDVLVLLRTAEKHGVSPETGFFVAVAVGHRIHEHGDSAADAIRFAEWSGVPDLQIKAQKATAAEIINDCVINRELSRAMLATSGALPPDVVEEIRAMAKVAGLPGEFDDTQIIVSLHGMKHHGDTLEEAIRLATGDSDFAEAVRAQRLN